MQIPIEISEGMTVPVERSDIPIDQRPNRLDPKMIQDILNFMDLANGLYHDVKERIEQGLGYKTMGEWIFHFGTFGTFAPLYWGCPALFYMAVKQTMYDLESSDGLMVAAIQRGGGDLNKTHWELETMKDEKAKKEFNAAQNQINETKRSKGINLL